jgi:hypothetical protein
MPPFELASVQNAKMGLVFDVRSRLRFNNYEGLGLHAVNLP